MVLKDFLIVISLAVLALITILPFYDQSNLITVLWISSHFLNTRIPFNDVGWPGGPFFAMVWIPAYLSWLVSGLNLFYAYIVWKTILLVLIIGTSFLLSIFFQEKVNKNVLIFSLLNPALIYITLIWIQFNIIPVFFLTFSLYLLYFKEIRNSFFRTALSVVPMLIAIFTTYYPLIFIPTILLFIDNRKERLNLFSSLALLGIIFLVLDILFFRGFSFSYLNNLNGGGLPSTSYEGLQYFHTLNLQSYIILLGFLMIIVPLILYKANIRIYGTLYIILILFLYTSGSAGFDVYLWLFPLSVLAVLELKKDKGIFYMITVLNIPIFLQAIYSNFLMGTGFQQGIFYFGYSVFHINYLFVQNTYQFNFVVKLFNFLIIICNFIPIFTILYWNKKVSIRQEAVQKSHNAFLFNERFSILSKNLKSKKIASIVLVLIIVSVPASIVFNEEYSNSNFTALNFAPVGLFYPTFNQSLGNFAMSVNKVTYEVQKNTVTIFPDSPSVGFYRGLTRNYLILSLNVSPEAVQYGDYKIINTSIFSLSFDYYSVLNISKTRYLLVGKQGNLLASEPVQNFNPVSISIWDSINGTNILLSGQLKSFDQKMENFTVGKLTDGSWGLNLTFNYIKFLPTSGNGFYLIPIFYFSFFPLFLSPVAFFLRRRS